MTTSDDEPAIGIPDEQLPDDLQPGEDNPLAEGLEPGETVEDLLEGKGAEQSADQGAEQGTGQPDAE
ncbi:hypothetical protein [Nocardioides pantholopis]|uniref:hypothetical protein n=1 Tax=Nocardioides pantholopis TaxID=2483798 RepID=UPI000F073550|nr:hypothetical protein [Nocardioides pantholopis]